MSAPLKRLPRKNPILRTPLPTLPPPRAAASARV